MHKVRPSYRKVFLEPSKAHIKRREAASHARSQPLLVAAKGTNAGRRRGKVDTDNVYAAPVLAKNSASLATGGVASNQRSKPTSVYRMRQPPTLTGRQNARVSSAAEPGSQGRAGRPSPRPVVLEKKPRETSIQDVPTVRLEKAKRARTEEKHEKPSDLLHRSSQQESPERLRDDAQQAQHMTAPNHGPNERQAQHVAGPDESQVKNLLSRYIHCVLKRVAPGTQLSKSCVRIAAEELQAVAKLIAVEATKIAKQNNHDKVSSREVRAALFMALPEQLALEAASMGRADLRRREPARNEKRLET